MRLAEIIDEVFRRLYKCGAIFIPLTYSVAITSEKKNLTEYIFNDVCRNNLNKDIHFEIFIRDINEPSIPVEEIVGLTYDDIYGKLQPGENLPLF
jgi:hypothetical protein